MRSASGANALGDDHVFDGDGNTGERSGICTGSEFRVDSVGGRKRALWTEMQKRVGLGVLRFRKLQGDFSEEVARGTLIIACVIHGSDGSMKAIPIPEEIAQKIEVAPAEMLARG